MQVLVLGDVFEDALQRFRLRVQPGLQRFSGCLSRVGFGVVSVAQLVRALDCGSRGWGFKSPRSPHFFLRP